MRPIEVIPSLPAATFEELSRKINKVCGFVDTFQIDVADGIFVPAYSWPMHLEDQAQFARLVEGKEQFPCQEKMTFEVHFMAHNPEKLLREWARIGIVRALFHVEAQHDFSELRSIAEANTIDLGIALKIDTPLESIKKYIEYISTVQLMGIAHIGAQGQPFDQRVIESIRWVKERYPDVIIEVDGSVNAETAPLLIGAGATRLAPGSYVFSADNVEEAIKKLKT